MRKITAATLRRKGACEAGVTAFTRLFPDGVVPTRALCLAHAQALNWAWGRRLLPNAARLVYDKAEAKARATYVAVVAEAWVDAAGLTGVAATAEARATYVAEMAKAWADAAGLTDDGED